MTSRAVAVLKRISHSCFCFFLESCVFVQVQLESTLTKWPNLVQIRTDRRRKSVVSLSKHRKLQKSLPQKILIRNNSVFTKPNQILVINTPECCGRKSNFPRALDVHDGCSRYHMTLLLKRLVEVIRQTSGRRWVAIQTAPSQSGGVEVWDSQEHSEKWNFPLPLPTPRVGWPKRSTQTQTEARESRDRTESEKDDVGFCRCP